MQMRAIFLLVLLLGVGLAGGAVYMANGYISQYQAQLERERAARAKIVKTVDVYVAKESLRYGDPITPDNVIAVKWPENALPEGVFTDLEALFPEGAERPRTALRAIEKFEPLLPVKMTEPGEDAGVASRLGAGKRAFAISVDVATGVSGFLRPGDRVDVYWTGRPPLQNGGERGGSITKLIGSNIRLIAVDQIADSDRASPTIARTVTVEASPEEVARLAQAQSTGKLSLALVGVRDETVVSGVEIDQRELLGIEDAPEPVEEVDVAETEPEVCTIRTRRGSEVVITEIPCTN
jgi:pilus assembly protein CpaB